MIMKIKFMKKAIKVETVYSFSPRCNASPLDIIYVKFGSLPKQRQRLVSRVMLCWTIFSVVHCEPSALANKATCFSDFFKYLEFIYCKYNFQNETIIIRYVMYQNHDTDISFSPLLAIVLFLSR